MPRDEAPGDLGGGVGSDGCVEASTRTDEDGPEPIVADDSTCQNTLQGDAVQLRDGRAGGDERALSPGR